MGIAFGYRAGVHDRTYAPAASGLNKKTLSGAVASETGESKALVGRVLTATLDAVCASVQKGDKVALSGFGTFSRKNRAARAGRNPQTGAALKIPAANYPSFSASSVFKALVKGK